MYHFYMQHRGQLDRSDITNVRGKINKYETQVECQISLQGWYDLHIGVSPSFIDTAGVFI